jgi:hypothetical protein
MGSAAKQLLARNGISLSVAINTTVGDARRVRLTLWGMRSWSETIPRPVHRGRRHGILMALSKSSGMYLQRVICRREVG